MAHASDEVLYSFLIINRNIDIFISFYHLRAAQFLSGKNAFPYRRIRTVLLHDTICYQTLPLHDLFAREKTNGYTNEVFRIRGTIELQQIG